MYTSYHNHGKNYGDVNKGHSANGFTTDGGFCEYQFNHINTLGSGPIDRVHNGVGLWFTRLQRGGMLNGGFLLVLG